MTRIENEFLKVVKKHLPSATSVELITKRQTLFVFFSTKKNEFDVSDTKSVRMLKIYNMMGEEHFDEFLSDVENLYKIFSMEGDYKNLDITFLFV